MTTRTLVLTNTAQLVTNKAALVQATGSQTFSYSFGTSVPENTNIFHSGKEIYQDGSLGNMYAWSSSKCILTISEAT